jgi:hypothetical protein
MRSTTAAVMCDANDAASCRFDPLIDHRGIDDRSLAARQWPMPGTMNSASELAATRPTVSLIRLNMIRLVSGETAGRPSRDT